MLNVTEYNAKRSVLALNTSDFLSTSEFIFPNLCFCFIDVYGLVPNSRDENAYLLYV